MDLKDRADRMKLYQTSNARPLALEESEGHPSAVLKHHDLICCLFVG